MGFPISSKTLGNLNRGEPGFVIGGTNGSRLFFFIPSSDVSQAYGYTGSTVYNGYSVTRGKGKWLISTFSTSRFHWVVWNGQQDDLTTSTNKYPKFIYIDPDTRTSDPNASVLIAQNFAYANGMFMQVSYCNSATAVNGNAWTSVDGNTWNYYYGVLPSQSNAWLGPIYNSNNNTWILVSSQSPYTTVTSTTDGASWTTQTNCPLQGSGIAIGNGTIVVPNYAYNTNQVAYSTNNGATWNIASTGSIFNASYIRAAYWNEADQQFVIAGGAYNSTDFDARIATSPDGITWTSRESGTKKCIISNIHGDNAGNYVAVGQNYSSGFIATDVYLYSTDSGVTWNTGTLPTSASYGVGFSNRISWGDPKDIT